MRRVTVRVQQDGDWLFRAERTDGQVLFEIQFAEDGAPPAAAPAQPAPEPEAPAPVSPVNDLLDNDETKHLDEVLRALGLNMPEGPPLSRVVEIGGGIGEMTKRLHHFTSGDRSEPVYMVDPFIEGFAPEFLVELRSHQATNVASIAPRVIEGTAAEVATKIPMNADLVCLSAALTSDAFESVVIDWIPHLSPSGMFMSRLPIGISLSVVSTTMASVDLEVADLGHGWFLATRKESAA